MSEMILDTGNCRADIKVEVIKIVDMRSRRSCGWGQTPGNRSTQGRASKDGEECQVLVVKSSSC